MAVFEYYDSDTGSVIYHVVPDLGPDNDVSTIQSETESTISGDTIQSDEVPGYFVRRHGRLHFASDNIVSGIPMDSIQRHTLQYLLVKWLLGGHYIGLVNEILTPVPGKVHRALELGTRTGLWAQSMAAVFPHVHFRSLDMAPILPHIPRPNVTFEVYDFAEGLQEETNSQDIVFMHNLATMIKDYPALLREVHRVLRPGGLVHSVDFSWRLWDSENDTVIAQRTNPKACSYIEFVRGYLAAGGVDPDAPTKLSGWLTPNSNLWGDLKNGITGFDLVRSAVPAFPVYPHEGFPCAQQLDVAFARLVARFTTITYRDSITALKGRGIPDEEIERLVEDAIAELRQPECCPLVKLYAVCAVKI